MGHQLALTNAKHDGRRLRLPSVIPAFNTTGYWIFTSFWMVAFALAVVGPIAGFHSRYTAPANNSQLLLGSRAGVAVSPRDATLIRFPVGRQAERSGIMPGDRIVAVFGLPLPATMPVDERALAEHANDPAYIAMGNVLFGTDQSDVPLTIRSPDGKVRDITVTTGEQHIDDGAQVRRISPRLLSFIDSLQLLSYPSCF